MYCPQCASPIDGVKFCRSCGANVSLVPQALTGQLPPAGDAGQEFQHGTRFRSGQAVTDTRFVIEFFAAIGFLIASFIVLFGVPAGVFWGWSLLIPAFMLLGGAVGGYMKYRDQRRLEEASTTHYGTQAFQTNQPVPQISAPTNSELVPPSSITEDTTKHLDPSRRHE
jgi:hypothetical protein